MNTVYMLQCNDDSFYTGWTNRFEDRMTAHAGGLASKYTRARRPVRCILRIYCESQTQARSVEAKIKQLDRRQKLRLLRDDRLLSETLYKMTGRELAFENSFQDF